MTPWRDKLDDPRPPVVKPAPINIAGMRRGQMMLVPTARQIDEAIRRIPEGASVGVKVLRTRLAVDAGAEVACPITTGFHMRTVAEAAWERHASGTPVDRITPFWRVIDAASPTLKKLSFDAAFVHARRKAEGLPR